MRHWEGSVLRNKLSKTAGTAIWRGRQEDGDAKMAGSRSSGVPAVLASLTFWGLRGIGVSAILMLVVPCHAANWFVRPNGGTYGAENGTDWNNAFDGFADIAWAGINPGDTIWVAGGVYTQDLVPAKSGTSGSRVAIQRARSDASACTGASGWNSSFDSTVHQTRSGITFNSFNFVTVSGRMTAAGGSNGWWIDFQGATSGTGIEWPNDSTGSNILAEYIDIQGPGHITYSNDGRGIDATPFSSAANNTFSHVAIFGWESGVYNVGIDGTVFQYLDMYDIGAVNSAQFHPNGIYTSGANGLTVRYSRFHRGPGGFGVGEGIFVEQSGGVSNLSIYGNVFYDIDTKTIQITGNTSAVKIFNNTFDNAAAAIQIRTDQGGACSGSSETRNNLFLQATADTCGTMSNNVTAASGNVFANRATHDYHIVNTVGAGFPRNAGTALTSNGFYEQDADGMTRGADGSWDAGAYEVVAGNPPPACTLTLSVGANIASAVSSAVNGSTICLNNGNYGSVSLMNMSRTGFVTLTSVSGVGAQMSPDVGNSKYIRFQSLTLTSGDVGACSTHIEFVRNTWLPDAPGLRINGSDCNATPQYILIDGDIFDRVQQRVGEGRLYLYGANTITVRNSIFSGNPANGGLASDGIQMGGDTRNLTLGPGNLFRGIYQDTSSGPHVDSIQCYNGLGGTDQDPVEIYGNYFYDDTVFLGYYGGACGGLNIHDNVFDTGGTHTGGSNCQAIQMGGLTNVHFHHNTLKNFVCGTGIGTQSGQPVNAQWIIENNIVDGAHTGIDANGDQPGCGSDCMVRYNLKSNGGSLLRDDGNNLTGNAVYSGAPSYANWPNWKLAAASPGHAAANDGLDMGTLYYGGGVAPSGSACDLNSDSAINVADVQICANQAIGTAVCAGGDINKDGACNVVDVQRTVNAALGGQCVTQ
jgi:hypothetical protein